MLAKEGSLSTTPLTQQKKEQEMLNKESMLNISFSSDTVNKNSEIFINYKPQDLLTVREKGISPRGAKKNGGGDRDSMFSSPTINTPTTKIDAQSCEQSHINSSSHQTHLDRSHSSNFSNFLSIKRMDFIGYSRPILDLVKDINAAIVFTRLEYWFDITKGEGFYKFLSPNDNRHYRLGDSWTEELGFSEFQFRTAFDKIGVKHKSYTQFIASPNPFLSEDGEEKYFCSYHDHLEGTTWYFRNHSKIAILTGKFKSKQSSKKSRGLSRSDKAHLSLVPDKTEIKDLSLQDSGAVFLGPSTDVCSQDCSPQVNEGSEDTLYIRNSIITSLTTTNTNPTPHPKTSEEDFVPKSEEKEEMAKEEFPDLPLIPGFEVIQDLPAINLTLISEEPTVSSTTEEEPETTSSPCEEIKQHTDHSFPNGFKKEGSAPRSTKPNNRTNIPKPILHRPNVADHTDEWINKTDDELDEYCGSLLKRHLNPIKGVHRSSSADPWMNGDNVDRNFLGWYIKVREEECKLTNINGKSNYQPTRVNCMSEISGNYVRAKEYYKDYLAYLRKLRQKEAEPEVDFFVEFDSIHHENVMDQIEIHGFEEFLTQSNIGRLFRDQAQVDRWGEHICKSGFGRLFRVKMSRSPKVFQRYGHLMQETA